MLLTIPIFYKNNAPKRSRLSALKDIYKISCFKTETRSIL